MLIRRRILIRVLALLVMVTLLEALSGVAIAVVPYPRITRARTLYAEQTEQFRQLIDRQGRHHVVIHPVLGWIHAANYPAPANRMNSAGIRGPREYERVPRDGVLRVAAFGDSFVYGAEVDYSASWAGQIETGHGDLEVLNYGVAGYGVDQAYLRYLSEGAAFSPRVVLMGFVPDDINRTVSVYRRFLSPGAALFKPRYVVTGAGELALRDVPLKGADDYEQLIAEPERIREIGRYDYWYPRCVYENPLHDYSATIRLACAAGSLAYRRYIDRDRPIKGRFFNEHSSAFTIQAALFEMFTAAVRERGAVPLIVMLPDIRNVRRVVEGQSLVYEPLLEYLRQHRLPHLDGAEAFASGDRPADVGVWFEEGGHYSAAGNGRVAEWLTPRLRYAGSEAPPHTTQ